MLDFVEAVKQVGFALDIGYWMIELEHRVVYWPRGLGRPPGQDGESGYVASPLDKVTGMIAEEDQGRFRGFLAAILRGGDETIEVTHHASWGGKVRLRLAGRQVGVGHDARIVGLVHVVDQWREAERLAKSVSHIVEALFISSDSGIIIFDDRLRVRRLNRNALDLFGVTEADEAAGDWSAVIERKLPQQTRELLLDAITNSTAVSGNFSLGGLGGRRLSWRANPWGSDVEAMSGLVMTLDAKRQIRAADLAERDALRRTDDDAPPPAPTLPPAPVHAADSGEDADARHRALEWVKHPILLVSIATGEIAFANRAAREAYHLPAEKRSFVENVYDLSGFGCDVDSLAIAAAGGHVLRLRLGARVGRMLDYDADLLFVEYHEAVPHPHAVARPAAAVAAAPASAAPLAAPRPVPPQGGPRASAVAARSPAR